MLALNPAIDSVPGADMNPQFRDTLTYGLRVAKIARLNLAQPGSDPGFCHFVAKPREPLCERTTPTFFLVVAQFYHGCKCSIKATNRRVCLDFEFSASNSSGFQFGQ
jgi:hypothetical protein